MLLLVICSTLGLHAQAKVDREEIIVTGLVTDESHEPLVGVNVVIQDRPGLGAITDINGKFKIKMEPYLRLVISFIGFETQEILIKEQKTIKVVMKEAKATALDEVVVTGNGEQRKLTMTGAVTNVDVSTLKTSSSSITNALAGNVAGVLARQTSGMPGENRSEFWIRGISTFGAGSSALVLVDGFERSMNEINIEDIETFTVLKDASATAIYGSRGANGVVLITTKRGKEGKVHIDAKVETTYNTRTYTPELVDGYTYATLMNEARITRNQIPFYSDEDLHLLANGLDKDLFPNVDWMGMLLKKGAPTYRATLNINGGGSLARYYVSKQREKEQKYLKDFELFRDVSIYAIQRVFLDVFLVDIPTDSIRLVLAQGGYMNMKEIQGYDKILNQKLCRYVRDKEEAVKKLSIAQIKKNIALTKDHKLEYTFELRNEKGRKCWYKYYISYFHENTEKLLVLVKDVTNTTRLEDEKRLELEAALLQAKKANDAKNAFLSNMSHDIRTPMNVITNMAKMVLEEPENKTQVLDYMNKICSMSTFLMGVISDILDVSKMESGKLQLRKEPYSCIELHDTVCAMMEPLCREKNITFYTNLNPQNDIIFTDKTKLNRIFFNLLGNAVKFTPAGGEVSFLHKNIVRKDGFLEWDTVIADTGSGMSKEFQRKMYQPFEQENQLVTGSLAGVGLGLAIVKMNTEAFGGTIAVESEPGKGTAFTIHLKAPYMSGEDYHMHYTASKLQTDLAGKKILLVEDHKLNMEIAKKILEKKQMKVTCAYNGAEAVALFEKMPEYTFDAVIMDIRMPVMNGLEAAAAIRAGAKADAKTIPIIAMSANAFAEDMEKSRRAGMNRHVAKPVEPERLFGVLSEIFSD